MVFELLPTGKVFLKTAFYDSEENINNWIKKGSAITSLPKRIGPSNFDSKLPSIFIVQDSIGVVNKESYYQMAGERANNAALDKLVQAKSMAQEDRTPEDILKETGWLKGVDGKWRFEIPDNVDNINISNNKLFSNEAVSHLPDVYDNPMLYEG